MCEREIILIIIRDAILRDSVFPIFAAPYASRNCPCLKWSTGTRQDCTLWSAACFRGLRTVNRGREENLPGKMVKELIEIAAKGDIERLKELFEDPESIYSTDPAQALNRRGKDGKSALDIAAMLGRKEIVRELLEHGADINSQTKKGIILDQGEFFFSSVLVMYLSITKATLLFQYGDWDMYVAPLLILFQNLCNQNKLEFRDFAKQTEVSRLGLEFH